MTPGGGGAGSILRFIKTITGSLSAISKPIFANKLNRIKLIIAMFTGENEKNEVPFTLFYVFSGVLRPLRAKKKRKKIYLRKREKCMQKGRSCNGNDRSCETETESLINSQKSRALNGEAGEKDKGTA